MCKVKKAQGLKSKLKTCLGFFFVFCTNFQFKDIFLNEIHNMIKHFQRNI